MKYRVDLCVDDIQNPDLTLDELNTRGMMGCNKWSVRPIEEDGLLDNLYGCGNKGGRVVVCDHVKQYILEHFEPKVKDEDNYSFSDRMTLTHGGMYYGGYVGLPHGNATVEASDEAEAVRKALAGLSPLVKQGKNYATV